PCRRTGQLAWPWQPLLVQYRPPSVVPSVCITSTVTTTLTSRTDTSLPEPQPVPWRGGSPGCRSALTPARRERGHRLRRPRRLRRLPRLRPIAAAADPQRSRDLRQHGATRDDPAWPRMTPRPLTPLLLAFVATESAFSIGSCRLASAARIDRHRPAALACPTPPGPSTGLRAVSTPRGE